MSSSPIDRLQATNPLAEIWWDSSPLVFKAWRDEMIAGTPEAGKKEIAAHLDRLNDLTHGKPGSFRGCTTNPPLSLTAVKAAPEVWDARIDALAAEHPDLDAKGLAWLIYKEVIQRGAEAFRVLWEASEGRYGYVSGQLDPRLFTETDEMIRQASEIRALAPNVMVKVPASTQGVDVMRAVTAEGIPTNTTTCFTVPQVLAVAKAAMEGLALAKKNGVDTSKWRAVITLMLARLTERPVLDEQAKAYGVDLTAADKKWFGLAVFKHAYRLLEEGGFPSKLLLCSVRPGPVVAGRTAFWDIEEVAGGNIVYTLPPYGLSPLFRLGDGLDFQPEAIHREVPEASLDRILQLPYGLQSYEPQGLSADQFNAHPATLYTVAEFSKSSSGLEEYVANRLAAAGRK